LPEAGDDLLLVIEAPLARRLIEDWLHGRIDETRDIHRAGGRYVTLVGSNPLFHLPQDRWPYAVDADVVTRVAAAAAALVVKLTR
jgi:hypothetical protein